MKKLVLFGKYYIFLMVLSIMAVQITWAAEIDLLNLANLQVSDTSLGTNLIVKEDSSGVKYIVGSNNIGQFLAPVNVPMESEVQISGYFRCCYASIEIFLLADEEQIKLLFYPYNDSTTLSGNALTTTSKDESSAAISGYNTVRLALTGGEAKVYINDVFSQKVTLRNPNVVFTQIKVNDIGTDDSREMLYNIKAGGNVSTVCSTIPTGANTASTHYDEGFDAGKQACISNPASCSITVSGGDISCPTTNSGDGIQLPTIAPNLNLHIPTIEYQSLGGKMNLWVDLQFTTTDDGKMWWILDDYGVNP